MRLSPCITVLLAKGIEPETGISTIPTGSMSAAERAGVDLRARRILQPKPGMLSPPLFARPAIAVPQQQPAATAAGHSESFLRLGNGHLAKMTNSREAEIYQKFGKALRGTIPETVPFHRAARLPGVTPEQVQALQQLKEKASANGRQVVVMQALGANIPKADKIELDVKIGASTASRTELLDAGELPLQAMTKKAKMTAADLLRGSRSLDGDSRGYTLIGRTQGGEHLDSSRAIAGRFSEQRIRETLDGSHENRQQTALQLLRQLENIQAKMKGVPVTFVASSVLISIDQRNPRNTVARLIDLAHPVQPDAGSADYAKLKAQFEHGLEKLIAVVRQLAQQPSPSGKSNS